MQETPVGRENAPGPSPGPATTIKSDFAIPSDLESTQGMATVVPSESALVVDGQPPLVVIEYRYRGAPSWLVLTLLLFVAALGIVSYRRLTPPPGLRRIQQSLASRAQPTRDANRFGSTTKATAGVPDISFGPLPLPAKPSPDARKAKTEVAASAPSPPVLVAANDVVSRTEATPREDTVAPVSSEEPSSRPSKPERHPIGLDIPKPNDEAPPMEQGAPSAAPDPPATTTIPKVAPIAPPSAPAAPPPVSNDEIERNIAKESEQRQAELDLMRQARGDARRVEQQDAVRQAYDQRQKFHRELREIVRKGGANAGKRIDELCEQYGRELPADQQKAVSRRLKSLPERSTRQDRIALLRAYNIPEPVILDDVARYLSSRLKNARNGVRSSHEAFVKAAQQLLAVPPPASNSGAPQGAR